MKFNNTTLLFNVLTFVIAFYLQHTILLFYCKRDAIFLFSMKCLGRKGKLIWRVEMLTRYGRNWGNDWNLGSKELLGFAPGSFTSQSTVPQWTRGVEWAGVGGTKWHPVTSHVFDVDITPPRSEPEPTLCSCGILDTHHSEALSRHLGALVPSCHVHCGFYSVW